MKKQLLAAWMILSSLAFIVQAEAKYDAAQAETKYETEYSKCIAAAGTMNNGVMSACSEEVSVIAKQDINRYYKQIEANINERENKAELLKQLETSQKAWIQYRNNHCALSEMLRAGSRY